MEFFVIVLRLNDIKEVRRMTGEEETLVDELYTHYRAAMPGRALQYMKHMQDAEDVVSDA